LWSAPLTIAKRNQIFVSDLLAQSLEQVHQALALELLVEISSKMPHAPAPLYIGPLDLWISTVLQLFHCIQ